jgi:hypothetical protein
LPKGVAALGFVILFMDMSSQAIHALVPMFLVGTLGASAFCVGLTITDAPLVLNLFNLVYAFSASALIMRAWA